MITTSKKIKKSLYVGLLLGVMACVYLLGNTGTEQIHSNLQSKHQSYRNLNDKEKAKTLRKTVCEDRKIKLDDIDKDKLEKGKEYRTDVRKSWREENKLKSFITDQEADWGEQAVEIGVIVAPYLIFALFSFFGYWIYCCCQCCPDGCCPPCKMCADKSGRCCCCQCDQKTPYKGIMMYYPIVGMFIALLWIAIVGIVGLGDTGGVEEGFDSMQCAIVKTISSINYGDDNYAKGKDGFMGVTGFQAKLSNLANEVDTSYRQSVADSFGQPTDWIATDEAAMNAEIDKMEQEWSGVSGITYDAAKELVTYTTAIDGDKGTATQHSCYFSSQSKNTDATFVAQCPYSNTENPQKWEVQVKATRQVIAEAIKPTNEAAQNVQTQGESINNDIDNFAASIKDGQQQMIKLEEDFAKQMIDLNDNLEDVGKQIKDNVTPFLEIGYGAFIGISIFLGVISALMIVFKYYCLRHFLTIFWALFAWLAFVFLLVGAILLVVSIAGSEVCDFMHIALNDPVEFAKIKSFEGDPSLHLTTCTQTLGGNGDMMKNFDMEEQFSQLDALDAQIAAFEESKVKGAEGMANLTNYIGTLTGHLTLLTDTAMVDGANEVGNLAAHVTALTTYAQACGPNYAKDQWKQTSECGGSDVYLEDQHEYITFSPSTTQKDMDGAPAGLAGATNVCIWFNGQPSASAAGNPAADSTKGFGLETGSQQTNSGSSAGTKQRYRSCTGGAPKNDVLSSMNNLMSWRNKKNELAAYKHAQTQAFQAAFNTYNTNYNDYVNNIGNFTADTNALTDSITNKQTGLLAESATNCLFIGESLHDFNNAMCSVFFVNFYSLTQTLHYFGFGLCFASLFMWCTSMRFAKNMKLAKKNQVNIMGETEKPLQNQSNIPLHQPVQMNTDGAPLTVLIYDDAGQVRKCPDGQDMVAMVYQDGNPVLDQEGFPVDATTYGPDGYPLNNNGINANEDNNYVKGDEPQHYESQQSQEQ